MTSIPQGKQGQLARPLPHPVERRQGWGGGGETINQEGKVRQRPGSGKARKSTGPDQEGPTHGKPLKVSDLESSCSGTGRCIACTKVKGCLGENIFGGTHAVFDGGPSMCDAHDLTDGKAQEPDSHSESWRKPSSLCFFLSSGSP